jgi:signal transduction histidine kinase
MSSQKLRFSVTRKVAIGFGLIIAIGMISMLMIYRGLDEVEQALERLAAVQAPLNAAAYELELNVNGMGLAVLKYLATRTAEYRSWAENDEQDFARYLAEYLRLAGTEQERHLALRVGRLHRDFASLGHTLMSHADEQERLYAAIEEHAEHVDVVIDARLQPGMLGGYAGRPGDFGAAVTTADLEAETAEVVSAVASYHRRPTPEARETIIARLDVLDRTLANLTGFNLSEEERRHLPELRGAIAGIAELSKEVIALEDAIRAGRQQFIEQRMRIDSLLDDEIQVLALRGMDEPRSAAKIAADRVVIALRYLIPLFLLSSGAIGCMLVRVIRAPLRQLSRGTKAIADGELNYRVRTPANDEFGDLAEQYNLMAEKLQATTVSRERLEVSDSELRRTVAELRDEITARERAERERESLQKELRRSETMAAMGALVAGVAHEVRNPLFAISSTLDAMSARFDEQPQRHYVDVLRTEVGRLNKLVADLLAYGKPLSQEFSTGPLRAAVVLAVNACRASARKANVTIVDRLGDETPLVRLNQDRMVQVFRNVIENAIQHAPAKSSVTLEGRIVHESEQRWIECSVSDSGPGFDPVDLPRVFEPFFTRRRDGIGLGLALVQRIVDEHGGEIAARNRPEGGAVVTVRFQLAKA